MNVLRCGVGLAVLLSSSMSTAEVTHVSMTCPGPTQNIGHESVGRDLYGILDTLPAGSTQKFCNTFTAQVNIVGVACRIKPMQGANSWLCASGAPCDGITFGPIEFTVTREKNSVRTEECVTVANTSRVARTVQVNTVKQRKQSSPETGQ